MTGYYVMMGGLALIVTAIGIYDFLAERHNERERIRKRLLP